MSDWRQQEELAKRKERLLELLRPISWHPSSSLRARQNLVTERRKTVKTIYPFLLDGERRMADEWLGVEKHSGLWD